MEKGSYFMYNLAASLSDKKGLTLTQQVLYHDLIEYQSEYGLMSIETIKTILGNKFEPNWPKLSKILKHKNNLWFIPWLKESIELFWINNDSDD
jgi:hypothetical protein